MLKNLHTPHSSDYYMTIISDNVKSAIRDMINMFKENNLTEIDFRKYKDYQFKVIFQTDDGQCSAQWVDKIIYTPEDDTDVAHLTLIGEKGWEGFLDENGGDYFDVACQIGRIYSSVYDLIEILKASNC